jgi:predicted RNase H-like HicB family nuclease
MNELVFEVTQEEDGGYCARAVGEGIFTQGDTWEELREMAFETILLRLCFLLRIANKTARSEMRRAASPCQQSSR